MALDLTDPHYLSSLKEEYAPDATDAQFTLWIEKCRRDELAPVEDVVLQIRSSQEYDSVTKTKVFRKRPVYITTVRALTKIASRTGKYRGTLPYQWIYLDPSGFPSLTSEVPLPDPGNLSEPREPWAARVSIRHADFPEPVTAVVRFNAYAQTVRRGDSVVLNHTWATRGPEQLAKCGFAAALRAVFPEAAGMYLDEELGKVDAEASLPVVAESLVEPLTVPTVASVPVPVPVEAPTPQVLDDPRPETGKENFTEPAPLSGVSEPREDRLPNAEEKKGFGARLRKVIEGHDREAVRVWMEVQAGADIKSFTVAKYVGTLAVLETAKADGTLASLISPKKEEPNV